MKAQSVGGGWSGVATGLPTSKDKSYTVVVAPIREEIIVNEGKFLVGFCFVSEGKFLVGIPVGIEHLPSY
jgi:hypothetical protein